MSEDGITLGRWVIPETDLEERFDTPGGPGGQHANRSQTAVTVRLDIAGSSLPDDVKQRLTSRLGPSVEATSASSRSQWRNRALARKRLVEKLESALKERPARSPTKPSRLAREKRLSEKRARSQKKRWRKPPQVDD